MPPVGGRTGITMLDIVLDHEIGGVSVGCVFSARAGPTPIKRLPDLSTAESTIISPPDIVTSRLSKDLPGSRSGGASRR